MRHFLSSAATELNTEIRILTPDTEAYLSSLPWAGNVRQLENICRWLTVMGSGREIHMEDLPPELISPQNEGAFENTKSWELLLGNKVKQQLLSGEKEIAKTIIPEVESILIKTALQHTAGKRNEAALLLGYGRNTLTRKIKELNIDKLSSDQA
jgi:two-component system nitrogen regulation response regulator GlnG